MRSEMSAAGVISFEQVALARKPLGHMPLIVLSAGREVGEALPDETPEQACARVEFWKTARRDCRAVDVR
jgi:hypothetical protein